MAFLFRISHARSVSEQWLVGVRKAYIDNDVARKKNWVYFINNDEEDVEMRINNNNNTRKKTHNEWKKGMYKTRLQY